MADLVAKAPVSAEPTPDGEAWWTERVELLYPSFRRVVRGYDPEEVDAAVATIRSACEEILEERAAFANEVQTLREKVEWLARDADRGRGLLSTAQRDARRTEADARAAAAQLREEADRMLEEANARAAKIVREAERKADKLLKEARTAAHSVQQETEAALASLHEEQTARRAEVERLLGL